MGTEEKVSASLNKRGFIQIVNYTFFLLQFQRRMSQKPGVFVFEG